MNVVSRPFAAEDTSQTSQHMRRRIQTIEDAAQRLGRSPRSAYQYGSVQ